MITLRDALDARRYGGKAAQLAVALRSGLPVPDGVALDVADVEALARGAADAVIAALGPVALAVRSSAVDEDGAGASFAGMHTTVLGVRGADALVAAIRAVWTSAHAPGALAYRARLGLDATPRIAVVVQALVVADVAGVMFTVDPRTGEDVRVIEAAWGLGEAVVAGLVDPDRYVVERGGAVRTAAVADKEIAIRLIRDGGTEERPVAGADRGAACLDPAALAALDALATRCDAVYGDRAHDVEFAFEGGRLALLQRRPITRQRPRASS